MKKLTFNTITLVGRTNMPTLEISCEEEGTPITETYYLQPFRGYRFQCSGSPEGDGDYGCSGILHLDQLKESLDYAQRTTILEAMATQALCKLSKYANAQLPPMGVTAHVWYEFIDLVHRWAYNEKSNFIIVDRQIPIDDKED